MTSTPAALSSCSKTVGPAIWLSIPRTNRCGASVTKTACRVWWRFPHLISEFQTRHSFDYGIDIFDIDVSPDGRYLTGAITDLSGRQKLVRFSIDQLRKGEAEFEVLYDFEYNSPGNFVFSADGKYLYGSSYTTGVSNLFRYDFETKKLDVISNAETGLFRPLPLPDGSLIAFEYTTKGFVPARVPQKTLEDVSAVKYFGMAALAKYPVLQILETAAALRHQLREPGHARGRIQTAPQHPADFRLSHRSGL